MKRLFYFLILTLSVALVSCDEKIIEITENPSSSTDQPSESDDSVMVNLKGDVALSKDQVYDGDMLTISLANTEGLDILNNDDYRYNADYTIEVEYFVDDKSVGKTSDMKNGFALDYNVKGLATGIHNVSASCKGGSKLLLTTSITQISFTVLANTNAETTRVTLGTYFNMSTDLFEFVRPIVTYTDSYGEHKSEITPEMCEDNSFSVDNITYAYKTRRWDIVAYLIPGQTKNVTLNYVPKGTVSADPDKRYYFQTGLNIDKYSYSYKGTIYIGNITNINLDFNITINIGSAQNEPDDGLLPGKDVDEYIKQLCATTKTIEIVLDQEGKLIMKE